MKANRLALACLILLLPFAVAATGVAFKRIEVGQTLPDFQLDRLEGETTPLLSDLGTRATVVVFWANWNPRSAEFLADLQKLYAEHGPDTLQVAAVNAENAEWDPATEEKTRALVAEHGVTFPVLFDRDLAVFNDYGAVALPSAALADQEGKIVELLQGYASASRLEFRDRVLETLGVLAPRSAVAEVQPPPAPAKVRRAVQMAKLLIKKRRPRKAIKVAEKAIVDAPEFVEAHEVLIQALEAAGREDEAAQARDRLAQIHPPAGAVSAAPAEPKPTPAEELSTPAAQMVPAAAVQQSEN